MKSLENNQWVTGKGEKGEPRKKLSDDWLEDMMRLFLEARGRSSGGGDFATDWCHPASQCALWEAANKKKYGDIARTFQAFQRVCKSLRTTLTIRAVRAWCSDPRRMEIKNFGLPELTEVLAEMDRMRAGPDTSNPPVAQVAQVAGSPGGSGEAVQSLPGGPGEEDPGSGDEIMDDGFIDPRQNPVAKKTKELADASRRMISVYPESSISEFVAEVSTRPLDGRCIVLVEAPTSSVAVFHDLLQKVKEHGPSDYDLWVPLGSRWEMIEPVRTAIVKHLGRNRTQIFIYTASGGTQTARHGNTMGLFNPSRAAQRSTCASHVAITGKHAMRCEKLHDYCTNPTCNLRSKPTPSDPTDDSDEKCEFDADDVQDMEAQTYNFEPGELEMPNGMEEVLAACAGGPAHVYGDAKPIRLYNWSAPQRWWTTLLQEVCQVGETCKVGFVFSRTAHPGAIVAMRSLGMRVYALKCGVSQHCQWHGDALLDEMLLVEHVEKARALAPSTGEAEMRGTLQFIQISAPQVDGVHFFEVQPHSDSEWRGGINKRPTNMALKLGNHYAQERRKCTGTVEVEPGEGGVPIVKSVSHLREGSVLGLATALLYDSPGKASAFLHSEPLATLPLAGSLVEVQSVRSDSDGHVRKDPPQFLP